MAMQIDYDALARAIVKLGPAGQLGLNSGETDGQTAARLAKEPESDSKVEEKASEDWADACSESSASVLSGGIPDCSGYGSAKSVEFGSFVEAVRPAEGGRDGSQEQVQQSGFFKTHVNRSEAKLLGKMVKQRSGSRLPSAAKFDLAVITYTAGTMPSGLKNGKATLRSLAAVGDAAISLHLAAWLHLRGETVESAQAVRSRMVSNAYLTQMADKRGIVPCVSYAPGVDAKTSVATATAVEALIGVMTLHLPNQAVSAFLQWFGILQ